MAYDDGRESQQLQVRRDASGRTLVLLQAAQPRALKVRPTATRRPAAFANGCGRYAIIPAGALSQLVAGHAVPAKPIRPDQLELLIVVWHSHQR